MAEPRTIEPGTLRIATVSPFPPFAVDRDGQDSGFDAELMRAVCGQLGLRWRSERYDGPDCAGIFDGLRTGDFDAVVAATSITTEREMVALFSTAYLEAGHSVLIDTVHGAHVASPEDLATEVLGVEVGRTSLALGDEMLAGGKVQNLRRYPCGGTAAAVDDLVEGRVGAVLTLTPVAAWFAREHETVAALELPGTDAQLGVAFAPGNVTLRDAVNEALDACRSDGVLERLERRWMRADEPVG